MFNPHEGLVLPAVPALGDGLWCTEWLGNWEGNLMSLSRQFSGPGGSVWNPPVLGRFSHQVLCFSELELLEVVLKYSHR